MKRSLLLAPCLLLATGLLPATTTPFIKPAVAQGGAAASGAKTWALLVGVSQYNNDQISGLNFPAKDAAGLKEALLDPTIGGLKPDQLLLLTNEKATRANIQDGVNNFLKKNVKPGDKVIVFLAGHGVAKGVGLDAKSYLLPTDVKGLTTQALQNSAVDLQALAIDLGELPASQFVVFVDACREDPTPGRGLKANAMSDVLSRGMQVVPQDEKSESATFFACSVGQRAYEDAKFGHGVFTNWILDGLRKGAVPKSDGSVDMRNLSTYVSQKVSDWAKNASATGDLDYEQTPELVANEITQPIILMRVKRPVTGAPIAPSPLVVKLQPTARGAKATTSDDPASKFYAKAVAAENRSQWEVAEQGYAAAIAANPKFVAAYEALGELHRLQNRNADAVGDALGLYANAPRGPHPLAVLSRAYSRFAQYGPGKDNATKALSPVGTYKLPKNPNEAMFMGQKAATEAVAADANSPEANLAQGYALAALDLKGKNKRAALAAFGKAVLLDESDASTHLGLGYGIRFYAVQEATDDERSAGVKRAITTLKQATKLRPNYYDAHRELAYCYVLLDDTDSAIAEANLASANRGAATDADEVAGIDVTMAGMHQKAAENATGDAKLAHQRASEGYMADAKETSTSKDLKTAMDILNTVGVSSSLASYVPANLRPLMDIKGAIKDKIRDKFKLPGGLGF